MKLPIIFAVNIYYYFSEKRILGASHDAIKISSRMNPILQFFKKCNFQNCTYKIYKYILLHLMQYTQKLGLIKCNVLLILQYL